MNNVLTGVAMGAALTTAGVYAPDIIRAQFTFSDFTMLQTFLSAAAGSTLVVTLSQTLGLTHLPPRKPSTLGLLPTRYDGNLIGGALLGAGMAIAGACPGTVLAQLGVGVASGRWALGGAVLAGIVWSGIRRHREASKDEGATPKQNQEGTKPAPDDPAPTLYTALRLSRSSTFLLLEAALALVLAAAARLAPADAARARGIPPQLAGLAIAAAQLVSLALRGSLLGASAAFEEVGGWVWDSCSSSSGARGKRKYSGVLFSAGIVGGAWLTATAVPAVRPAVEVAVSPARAVLGGFMIVLGARMAGGCTSGHGISGFSLMSVSSVVTVAATFAAGGVVGLVLG